MADPSKIQVISIHAPREGSDSWRMRSPPGSRNFYPRSPRGERQPRSACRGCHGYFYPRSPRGERHVRNIPATAIVYFYPRSPRGERPLWDLRLTRTILFLSTLPARGATSVFLKHLQPVQFLSTLPARGATLRPRCFGGDCVYFYPRSPRGERPGTYGDAADAFYISIHAPREGSDLRPLSVP